MALANVGRNMGTDEMAAATRCRPGRPFTVARAKTPRPRGGRTVPLYLLSDVEAAARRLGARRDAAATARQPESGYVVEAVARGRQEFRMRRDERAAGTGARRRPPPRRRPIDRRADRSVDGMTATTERFPPRIATPRRPRAQGRHADLGRVRIALAERDRMARFSALVAELEQVPPSPARDALVVTVRSRAVALETGGRLPPGGGRQNGPRRKRPHRLRLPRNLGCSATAASPRLVRRGRIEPPRTS